MTKRPNKPDTTKPRALVVLEYVLLALCLSVLALRVTFTESPTLESPGIPGAVSDAIYSLSVSAVLIFAFVIWLVAGICGNRLFYRHAGIETGLVIFAIAALIAGLAASNKRLAITDFTVLLAPVIMAILLVQILDSPAKIKIVLAVIVALGVVTAQQAAEQFLGGNQAAIDQYEKDPKSMLEPLGIEPNTFQSFMFEHRIYSKGVRGFFTTRNSAASFLLLAGFAAAALLIDQHRNQIAGAGRLQLLAGAVPLALILLSLLLTRSKGAFIGLFFAVLLLLIYSRFGNWLKLHRRFLFIACLILIAAVAAAVACYGSKRECLPGGPSMLVRGQYWNAAAKMYADHPLTGVGPGGFSDYYTQYKPDAALESVADPHNFLLSILTQYGPLGLAGFLAMLFVPIWRVLSPTASDSTLPLKKREPTFYRLALGCALAIAASLLIVRPITSPIPADAPNQEKLAAITVLYLMPVLVFLVGFLLAAVGQRKAGEPSQSVAPAALLSAVVGLLVHNLIDFAVFEPGVFTAFWAVVACLVATHANRDRTLHVSLKIAPVTRLIVCAAVITVTIVFLNYAFVPVVRSTAGIALADRMVELGQFDRVHPILESAAEHDPLDHAALTFDGRLYFRRFEVNSDRDRDLLLKAEHAFLAAIDRSPADFKNYERLTKTYILLAETAKPKEAAPWFDKAAEAVAQAIKRYPGCARLRVTLARIEEQRGNTGRAIEQYTRAVEIEDSYRRQFRMMYPERDRIVSRLDEDKYLFAKERLKEMTSQQMP
ncbi:MAG: O-antigen ligase family protein [Sedimentisphaerales bacterium]|nr:O-antigen ligase family protein [Sedimentisphaerales bacterium]